MGGKVGSPGDAVMIPRVTISPLLPSWMSPVISNTVGIVGYFKQLAVCGAIQSRQYVVPYSLDRYQCLTHYWPPQGHHDSDVQSGYCTMHIIMLYLRISKPPSFKFQPHAIYFRENIRFSLCSNNFNAHQISKYCVEFTKNSLLCKTGHAIAKL